MSFLKAHAIKALLEVADAGARGLARRQLEREVALGKRKPSSKREPSCSICSVPGRQERASAFVRDIQVIAGTREPPPLRPRKRHA